MITMIDDDPTYSCLLGRPWIHSARVDPSTLHHKLKFVVGGQLIIVSREEGILVSCLSTTPYVEAAEESLKATFQALEVVDNTYVESFPIQSRVSNASIMVARIKLRDGYKPEMGLGRNGDGMVTLLEVAKN